MSSKIDSQSSSLTYTQPNQEKKEANNNFINNVWKGSAGGICAVGFIQPLIYFKNLNQIKANSSNSNGLKNSFSLRVLYRGCGGFAASFIPTTALQTSTKGFLQNCGLDPFVSSVGAGVASSLVVCPAEGIMIQQQKTGENFLKTAIFVWNNYGVRGFFRGLAPTAVREGAFTAAYLTGVLKMKEILEKAGLPQVPAQLLAGASVGTAAAVTSQPFDTLKTLRQNDLVNSIKMGQVIFDRAAFSGLPYRIGMVTVATITISSVSQFFSS